jgi:hypothetical protein
MQVYGIKLSNGDEILARYDYSTNKYTQLFLVGLQQTPDGRMGLGMMPYITSNNDATVEINPDLIVCRFVPEEAITKSYLEKTSGIIL